MVRVAEGRDSSPSAGSLDSQTIPTAVMLNQAVGYDTAKKTKGRKRFTLVDTFGLLIAVKVFAASTPEREGAKQLLQQVHQERQRVPRLVRIWVDGLLWRRLSALDDGHLFDPRNRSAS